MESSPSCPRHAAAFNAVASGNARKLRAMLASGLDPQLRSNRKPEARSLLCAAAQADRPEVIDTLLQHGARPGAAEWMAAVRAGSRWSAWQKAWLDAASSEWLATAGSFPGGMSLEKWHARVISSHLGFALGESPDVATVRHIMALRAALPDIDTDAPLLIPLSTAVNALKVDVVGALLAAGASPVEGWRVLAEKNPVSDRARTLLLARRFLEAGVPVEAPDKGVPPWQTTLSRWSCDGFVEGVRLLLEHGARAAVCATSTPSPSRISRRKQRGPLEMAIVKGSWVLSGSQDEEKSGEIIAVVNLLLSHGASLDQASAEPAYPTVRAWALAEHPEWMARWDARAMDAAVPVAAKRLSQKARRI